LEENLYENGCFVPDWSSIEEVEQKKAMIEVQGMIVHKELSQLLRELEEINERIEDIKAREWHLARKVMMHNLAG
jgi:hypothetical protein